MEFEVPEREPEISLPLLKEFGSDLVNLYLLTIYCLARKFEVLISKRIVNYRIKAKTFCQRICLVNKLASRNSRIFCQYNYTITYRMAECS